MAAAVLAVTIGLTGCTGEAPGPPNNGNGSAEPVKVVPDDPIDNTITILQNDGRGAFALTTNTPTGEDPRFTAVADVDGDGLSDLVTASLYAGTLSVLRNDGDGRLLRAEEYEVGENPTFVRVIDLNGDDAPDLLVTNSHSDTISVLINQGDGTYAGAEDYSVDRSPVHVAVGDIDGDGAIDLVTGNSIAGTVSVLGGNPDGTYGESDNTGVGSFISSVVLAPLDKDDFLDVATANLADRTVTVLLSVGGGDFDLYEVGLWPHSITSADLNRDGSIDLLTANALSDSVSVLLNEGQGTFALAVDYPVGRHPNAMAVVDLNQDGAMDVATANTAGNTVSVLLNNGKGTFSPARDYSVGRFPNALTAADLNDDGAVDLATPNSDSDSVSVLLNNGNGTFAPARQFDAGDSPRHLQAVDLNQDGLVELLITGHTLPTLPPSPTSTTARTVIRTSVPAPRIWQPEFVLESYRRVGGLDGILCLPEALEWWLAFGVERSRIYKDQQWQNVVAREAGAEFFIQLDPYRPPREGILATRLPLELAGQTFASTGVREAFKAEALQRVRWYDAEYVCLAMEINAYFEQQPDDFENFLSLFIETREEIKQIKPEALVFVSFQYEQLLGRFGGLGTQTVHDPHWNLLEMFEPYQDAVALSSYPLVSLVPPRFSVPTLIPEDYYSRVSEHTNLPIIFAELGWSPSDEFNGSPESQAEFMRRFEDLTAGMNVILVNYFFLTDTKGFGAFFNTLGLVDRQGRPREAFDVWNSLWHTD